MNDFLVKTSGRDLGDAEHHDSVKTLMLLHGWGMNSQVWEPIRETLESHYHIVWVDLPGHGFNRNVKADSLEQMVDLIADITPENTHIMGWSLGGLVAQAIAQKIPKKIRSLTLVTSTPRFSQYHFIREPKKKTEDSSGLNSNSKFYSGPKIPEWKNAMSTEVLNRFADNLKQDTEKTLKGFIALQFIGVKNAKDTQNDLIKHILYNGESAKKWGGVFLDNPLTNESDLETINEQETSNIPTQEALDLGLSILKNADMRSIKPVCAEHWVFAEYDRLIPKEVINDLISLRPDAEITLLAKAGHAPFITHSEVFLKHAIDFIDAQP